MSKLYPVIRNKAPCAALTFSRRRQVFNSSTPVHTHNTGKLPAVPKHTLKAIGGKCSTQPFPPLQICINHLILGAAVRVAEANVVIGVPFFGLPQLIKYRTDGGDRHTPRVSRQDLVRWNSSQDPGNVKTNTE